MENISALKISVLIPTFREPIIISKIITYFADDNLLL